MPESNFQEAMNNLSDAMKLLAKNMNEALPHFAYKKMSGHEVINVRGRNKLRLFKNEPRITLELRKPR